MRRYDLDWLRVLVFALLILYHVGMFFVPWGWHLKNNTIYSWLIFPMIFVNQWRLPILFLISGMGTCFALAKRSGGQFAGERLQRLFIPLVTGILFIVPPQVYFERKAYNDFQGSYFDFWPSQMFNGVYPSGNFSWHHLWFLPYLLFFSLLFIPVFLYLRKNPDALILNKLRNFAKKPFGLFVLIIPLYFWESLVEPFFPSTHAFWGDWFNMVNYGTLFLYGFLLISIPMEFWQNVMTYKHIFLRAGIVSFLILIWIMFAIEDSVVVHFIEAGFKVFNMWCWIFVLFGYAATWLNKASATLSYANEAVYPFYILHQTVTVGIAYYIMDLDWNLAIKFSILLVGTFVISWILYEALIRRWSWMRPLFGMKHRTPGKVIPAKSSLAPSQVQP